MLLHIAPISFFFDIMKELMSAYYYKGSLINDHFLIAQNYFKGYFIFDVDFSHSLR